MRRLISLVAVAALSACAVEPPSSAPLPPALHFVDALGEEAGLPLLDFGSAIVGGGLRRTLLIENRSSRTVALRSHEPEAPFARENAEPAQLAPGARWALTLRFEPKQAGRYEAQLALGGGLELRLLGEGLPAAADCELSVEPRSLRFVADGGGRRPAAVELRATGPGACLLEEASLSENPGPFSLEVQPPLLLAPGASTTLQVFYDPAIEGSQEAELRISAGGKVERVALGTAAEASCARLEEAALRFEGVALACHSARSFHLQNDCPKPLRLLQGKVEGVEEWVSFEAPPTTLPPFGSARLWLGHRGASLEGRQAGALHLAFSNGDTQILQLELAPAREQEERFVAVGAPVDLLLVVDRSSEMQPYQEALADFAASIHAWMEQPELDLLIAVTTNSLQEEAGCPAERGALLPLDGSAPRVIEADTPDRLAALLARLQPAPCMRAERSQALEALRLAIEEPEPANWRREEAPLFVIFLSAAVDRSQSEQPAYDYESLLLASTGSSEGAAFVAAISQQPICGAAQPAYPLADLVALVGGSIVPICNEGAWSDALALLEELRHQADRPFLFPVESLLPEAAADGSWGEEQGLSLWLAEEELPISGGWQVVATEEGPQLELEANALPRSRSELLLRVPHACP